MSDFISASLKLLTVIERGDPLDQITEYAKNVRDSIPQYCINNPDFCPLFDVVFVRRDSPEEVSTGGIILQSEDEPELSGIIAACGTGKLVYTKDGWQKRPMSVSVGDRVLFSKHGHSTGLVNGVEYVILKEGSISAVIDPS